MKTFEEFRFSIPHNKVRGYKHAPKTKEELIKAIEAEIELQGPNADLNCIDTSEIINMMYLFDALEHKYAKDFNGDISAWDVSNAVNMNSMFYGAENFDGDISGWNVSRVKDMGDMFYHAKNFNQDISGWDVSNVEYTASMFKYARSFNQDISNWNVSNVKNMANMFEFATNFNQNISNWDVNNVFNTVDIFFKCPIKEEYKPKFK